MPTKSRTTVVVAAAVLFLVVFARSSPHGQSNLLLYGMVGAFGWWLIRPDRKVTARSLLRWAVCIVAVPIIGPPILAAVPTFLLVLAVLLVGCWVVGNRVSEARRQAKLKA